jgi:cytochrome P450 family 144
MTSTAATALFSADGLENPYPVYDRLRAEAPVSELPGTGMWLVTRHADVLDALSRPEDFSSHLAALLYLGGDGDASLVDAGGGEGGAVDVLATTDPPEHTAHRKLVSTAFTNRKMADLEPSVREFVESRLAPALARGRLDWIDQVALPLPITVVAGVLGLPVDDTGRLQFWSDRGIELLSGFATPERLLACSRDIADFMAYLVARIAEATDSPADTVVATLGHAARDGSLTELEAASLLLQLVSAGSDSTSSLVGSSARLLAEHPDLQDSLRANPAAIPAFVEEAVRLESPFRGHFRVTARDTELGGVELAAGTRLMLLWGAANRDAAVFDRPEEIDLDRASHERHVGFGLGIHFCVGAPLARLETRVALEVLLARTRTFRPAEDAPPRHVPSLFVRRLAELQLLLDPA